MRPECEHLTGRMRAICEGVADLSPRKINAYRARLGLPPLAAEDLHPIVQERPLAPAQKPTATSTPVKQSTTETLPSSYLRCQYRGPMVAEYNSRQIGVNQCGTTAFYNCTKFGELTTPHLQQRSRDRVVELGMVSGYLGRACRNCNAVEPRKLYDEMPKPKRKPVPSIVAKAVATLADKLTICVTHYKRPEALSKCLASLDQFWPNVPRVIQDTQGNLSRGRNLAIARAATPYVMICEEDFVFGNGYNLAALVEILDTNQIIGGASGSVVEAKSGRRWNWYANLRRFRGSLQYEQPTDWRTTSNGVRYAVCDLLPNAGVWRRSVFASCPWDEELEVNEHHEWFWRLHQHGQWRCAYVPSMAIKHTHDRPNQDYNRMRRRPEFKKLAERKMGASFGFFRGFPTINGERSSVVVLGIGHANTTIVTRLLHALGWKAGDADENFAESVSVRAINQRWERTKRFDHHKARTTLSKLPQPWAVKDPRFARGALLHWLPEFAPYRPVLLWIRKDLAVVLESYRRRGERTTPEELQQQDEFCADQFRTWPWGKLELTAEAIEEAVKLWRISEEPSPHPSP